MSPAGGEWAKVVVKVGTSSITTDTGELDGARVL